MNAKANSEREAFTQRRLAMLAGPGGSLSMVAMPEITATNQSFTDISGSWRYSAEGVIATASAADELTVDGHVLDGTEVLNPSSKIVFSKTRTATVGQEVDGTWYLQVSDSAAPNLEAFAELEMYPYDEAWVVEATYRRRAETDRASMAGRLGSDELHRRDSPGDVEFTLQGEKQSLAVYATFSPQFVTVNFTDRTSGSETPATGRILGMPRPSEGPVVLDFNQAMLLPHESSSVYPCPMPPTGNDLPVEVRAGERAVRFYR